ncbi:MAG: CPBP family intramembrane metalloprotease [Planctomycetes bacterium]|nr:CPBP family intramembrane metalloprotease [Planctomycetota bacterium]
MYAIVLLLLVPAAMWLSQTVLLVKAGLPVRARINPIDLPRHLKRYNRMVTYLTFLAVLVAYPLTRGQWPWAYYVSYFPLGRRPWELAHGAAAAMLYLSLLYVAWIASGNVLFRVRHERRRLIKRLAGVPLTALMVALLEELLFRTVLLADLLRSLDPAVAVAVGAAIFAGAHYVRSVKRYWTIAGHVVLGVLLCLAFVYTRALWLPVGLHAAGVVLLLGTRPFIRYQGPPWLIGASVFPYAGAVGVAALILLTVNVYMIYGGPR